MKRKLRTWLFLGLAPLTMALVMFAGTTPANAYVVETTNFRSFPEIHRYGLNRGNIVQFWQNVLWAEHYGTTNTWSCHNFTNGGQFGPNTQAATRDHWQRWHTDNYGRALSRDGKVGPNTWSSLWERIKWTATVVPGEVWIPNMGTTYYSITRYTLYGWSGGKVFLYRMSGGTTPHWRFFNCSMDDWGLRALEWAPRIDF